MPQLIPVGALVMVPLPLPALLTVRVPDGVVVVNVAVTVIPAGTLVTVPLPAPALLTVSVVVARANVAVTVVAAVIVTVHVPVPPHPPPLQPVKIEPASGVAVRLTVVPLA